MKKILLVLMLTIAWGESLANSNYISELNIIEGDSGVKIFARNKDLKMHNTHKAKNLKMKVSYRELRKLDRTADYSLEIYYYDSQGERILVNLISPIKLNNFKKLRTSLVARLENITESNYLYFDLIKNDEDKLITSYKAFLEVENQDYDDINYLADAGCDNRHFGQCQLEYILKNLKFSFYKSTTGENIVSRKKDGSYLVYVPVKKASKTRRHRARIKKHRNNKLDNL